MGVISVFFQALGADYHIRESWKDLWAMGGAHLPSVLFLAHPKFCLCLFDCKVGKGSNPDEELAFIWTIICSMYVLSRDSSGMSYKGGWLGLCRKMMLILVHFLYLPSVPCGMAASARVTCLVRNLLLRARCTQEILGTRPLGALAWFGEALF